MRIEVQHFLGDTLSKIAVEKAGIIKNSADVFLADIEPDAENEILKHVSSNYRHTDFWHVIKNYGKGYKY